MAWLNDGAEAECVREIHINTFVHIINAPPTSSPFIRDNTVCEFMLLFEFKKINLQASPNLPLGEISGNASLGSGDWVVVFCSL